MLQIIKLENSILGFKKSTPILTGKAKKYLHKYANLEGTGLYTYSEIALFLIMSGYEPKVYSTTQGNLKIIYGLAKDGFSYHFNKTVYDFSLYLIENNFLYHDTVLEYLENEKMAIEKTTQKEKLMKTINDFNTKEKQRIRKNHKLWITQELNRLKSLEEYSDIFTLLDLIHEKYLKKKPIDYNILHSLIPNMLSIHKPGSQDYIKSWLNLQNKGSRKAFEILSGVKLGKTLKNSDIVLNDLFSKGYLTFISRQEINKNIAKLKGELL